MTKRKRKKAQALKQVDYGDRFNPNAPIPPGCLEIDVKELSEKSIDNMSISPLALKRYYSDIEYICIGCGEMMFLLLHK